jgi:hypothetical protein
MTQHSRTFPHTLRRLLIGVAFVACGHTACAAQTLSDAVLYAFRQGVLFDGKFGKFAEVQHAISAALSRCGMPGITVDGRFGSATLQAIKALVNCPAIKPHLPEGSPAAEGAISTALWRLLLPASPLPSIAQRAQTLVLTHEDTDYDSLEWNFCQSKGPDGKLWSPDDPALPCYSNDPNSYITWGPRGATAGGGQEVQWILWRAEQQDHALLNTAFGAEAAAVRRFMTLPDSAARQFLCEVYIDKSRKAQWTQAFAVFGKLPVVQKLYDHHYLSLASDGAKMRDFYRLYDRLGVKPTEIDYAFFLDRATQSSAPAPNGTTVATLTKWLAKLKLEHTPANLRRAIATTFPTPYQKFDRLGRDMAFIVDAVSEARLTAAERSAWQNRGALSAGSVGFSDERPAPPLSTISESSGPRFDGVATQAAATSCPVAVLNPQRPQSRVARLN